MEKSSSTNPVAARTPVIFPAVAATHFVWLLWTIWDFRGEPFPSPLWAIVLWHCGYTLAWALAWKGLRIGAWAYLGLTSLNLVLRFVLADRGALNAYTDALFPFDILFSFFLLLYYKRFR